MKHEAPKIDDTLVLNDPPYDVTLGHGSGLSSYPNDPYIDITGGHGLILPQHPESVKGEMVVIERKFNPAEVEKSYSQSFVEGLKKEMALELAEKILQNKYVEFTKQENLQTNEVVYRARAYVTPDEKIRMMRRNNR